MDPFDPRAIAKIEFLGRGLIVRTSRRNRLRRRMQHRFLCTLSAIPFVATFINPAVAQVVIPYGDFGDGFEKYLIAVIAFVLLCFAVWRFFRNRS